MITDDPRGLTLEILKQIQATLGNMQERLTRLEDIGLRQRRDSAGMLVMTRAVSGDFDQRVSDVEERVRVLEERRPAS